MIWTLIKINVAALFAGFFKRNKKPSVVAIVLISWFVFNLTITFMIIIGAMFNSIVSPFFEAEIGWFYFALAGLSVVAMCFFGIVFMVQPQIFNARDNELLLSMPIRPWLILSGRLSSLLLIEYIFSAVILFPAFMVLLIRGYLDYVPTLGIVFFFASSLLLPLLALALGCLVGWLIVLMSSRIVRGKNIVMLTLSLAFLGTYLWLATRLNNYLTVLIDSGAEMAADIRRTLPPVYHLGVAIADGNIISFIIFSLFAIVPFAVMCALLSASLIKMATAARTARKVEYQEKAMRVTGAGAALFDKEVRRFWSLPTYVLNASLGVIATIIATVVLIVYPSIITDTLQQFTETVPDIDMGMTGVIALAAIAALNNVSAPSISLEGRQLWIIKSMPLLPREILLVKIGVHIAVCGIPTLLAGIVCIFVLPVTGALPILLMLALPMSITVMFALIGIALNLRFPRFDWINPIQPVKQGLSSILTLFGGIGLIIVLVITYVILSNVLAIETFLLFCTAATITTSAALYVYLVNGGIRKFEKL